MCLERPRFTFPLLCEALSFAKDMEVAEKRWAVLIGVDGKIEKLWPTVSARTFPEEALQEV